MTTVASCSQVAVGGHRWLLMAVRGHLGDTRQQFAGQVVTAGPGFGYEIPIGPVVPVTRQPVSGWCCTT
jgi:hypothetical protein